MVNILGISGSLRQGSLNSALLRAAAELTPPSAVLDIGSIAGIPLYDGDLEAKEGLPPAVQQLKERIRRCDGLLIVSPEYNNSIPGVFKNAIDWVSRPAAEIPQVFGARPVALMGATPGAFGTILSQNAWLPVVRTLGMDLWTGGRLMVPRAHTLMDADGRLSDEAMRERLRKFLAGYVAFLEERANAR